VKFSFIVIGRVENECALSLSSLRKLSGEDYEVLLSLGVNPSEQRNEAARRATGDYLVFLDNDSRIDPRLLHYYRDALSYEPGIKIVGGPSIYDGTSSDLKLSFQAVFASAFGLGPFRARYSSIGTVRRSSENELILCNLMVDRKFFLDEGGFNTNLYPNEENEFLNRVCARAKIYYHPLAICYRDTRESFRAFAKQIFRYGKGRAKHFVRFPTIWNQIFLVPAGFTRYCLGLLGTSTLALSSSERLSLLTPLLIYALFNISASIFAALGNRKLSMIIAMPLLFFACHFLYGLGFLIGVGVYPFLRRNRPAGDVRVLRISQNTETQKAHHHWRASGIHKTKGLS
jgi:succinoglycan biosynthesis protein ExoA